LGFELGTGQVIKIPRNEKALHVQTRKGKIAEFWNGKFSLGFKYAMGKGAEDPRHGAWEEHPDRGTF